MRYKNWRRFSLFLLICIFCLAQLYIEHTANAQYPVNNYYGYTTPNIEPSYMYSMHYTMYPNNTMYSNNTIYSNNYNYPWSAINQFGNDLYIPTPKNEGWTVHPSFGNTVYSAISSGDTLTIQGIYFSAHTQAGVNFNRTLSIGGSLYSMPYMQSTQTMYGNSGWQQSFASPASYYARQVLQFSPVLHGPLLNNY